LYKWNLPPLEQTIQQPMPQVLSLVNKKYNKQNLPRRGNLFVEKFYIYKSFAPEKATC
jgi:hypothetical protein